MATNVTQSLFGITPSMYQQAQAKALQDQAMQFARLTPAEKASMGFFSAGSQLGTGLAGLMGYQDPEMQRIKARQGLLGGIDMSDPTALRQAAQAAQQSGDFAAAQELVTRATTLETSMAEQEKARAEAAAKLREGVTTEQKNAAGWADTVAQRGTPEWAKAYGEKLNELTTKEGARINYGNEAEIVSRAMFGKNFNDLSQQEAAEVQKRLETMGVTKAKAGATNISTVVTNRAAEQFGSKFGQLTGEQAAQVEGKYSALDYIGEAKAMLDKGIYAGQWGPERLLVAKATAGLAGDIKKAENTEQFLAYVGNIVIPRLQEFGGNDSVEELRYLQRVVAGDQRLEANSMKAILDRAERAIKRGIERIKRQTESIGAGGTVPLDAGPSRSQPKATMRWNPQTKTLEKVQ